MKRYLLLLTLILTSVVGNAQKYQTPEQHAKLEAKYGIRDIKLDTPKSLYKDLYEVKNELPCGQMMKRTNENLYFGKAKVDSVRYLYINDTLKAIFLDFVPRYGSDIHYFHLYSVLEKLYGPPFSGEHDDFVLSDVDVEATSNCFQKHQFNWFAKSFKIATYYDPGTAYINFIKNDFREKCLKHLSK